jgi:outer membrane protein assembly factor BamB
LAYGVPGARAAGSVAYQADAQHTGALTGTGLTPPLGKQWVRRDLGYGAHYAVIAEGRVFLTSFAANTGVVHALDPGSGATLWTAQAHGSGGIAYAAGRVVTAGGGGVQAVAAADGRLLWRTALSGDSNEIWPVIEGGTVFVSTGDYLLALDAATGEIEWERPVYGGPHAAADAERVYVTYGCSTRAYSRFLGLTAWTHDEGCGSGEDGGAPVLADGRLHVRLLPSYAAILDAGTGSKLANEQATAAPAVAGGVSYRPVFQTVTAVEEESGRVLWEHRATSAAITPPLVVDGYVYRVTQDGEIVAVDARTGTHAWGDMTGIEYTDDRSTRSLAAGPGILVVTGNDMVVGYVPGPGRPGAADYPKPPPDGYEVTIRASKRSVIYGDRSVKLSGEVRRNNGFVYVGGAEIQQDPWPYGEWETLRQVGTDAYRVGTPIRPMRNTQYRVVHRGTEPPVASATVTIRADVRYQLRFALPSPRRLNARATLTGPPDAGLAGRRMYFYLLPRRGRAVLLAGGRMRRVGPGRARATARVRLPRRARRTDRYLACLLERSDDGFGRHYAYQRRCGRRRL